LEVRRILNQQVSVFSGEEFNVDAEAGLNGVCDFLISRSRTADGEAPAIVIVEAKNLTSSLELGSALLKWLPQRFNAAKGKPVTSTYGVITSGTLAVSEARGRR